MEITVSHAITKRASQEILLERRGVLQVEAFLESSTTWTALRWRLPSFTVGPSQLWYRKASYRRWYKVENDEPLISKGRGMYRMFRARQKWKQRSGMMAGQDHWDYRQKDHSRSQSDDTYRCMYSIGILLLARVLLELVYESTTTMNARVAKYRNR